ncbi:MBL fold metallo-hydrolase [Dyella psychrodurans]|uniref:MBL fold metallo-hydrolase n=1 Tax=Dyella psychrodurans TaxID=1927960 RepID=A0A370XEI0_9GAMM|nr:MBL fold metallo-hydrolase [Dyella psychrodurans]RDS86712.1 MBL fold metallo-hydrolase [Dyella psychrodurans]
MSQPEVKAFFDEPTNTFSYVVWDPQERQVAVIDSVLNYDASSGRTGHASADAMVAFIREACLDVQWLIETHAHADHLSAAPYIQSKTGGKIAIGEHIRTVQDVFGKLFNAGTEFQRDGSQFDHLFKDGERYRIGSIEATAMHTPGHTPACMTHLIGDCAFVGDTLFMPDYGSARCDFPGGDARALYHSVRRLFELPDDTRLFMCHDYKTPDRTEYRFETTLGEERRSNIHLHEGISEEAFVEMRKARDATLATPRLLLPSIQVNMRAGYFPPAEGNGIRYIKIPLDTL